jgi:dTDP-4-dehydrorhamnose reductase
VTSAGSPARAVLVTGGTGYLGSELVRREPAARGVGTADFDVRDARAVRKAVAGRSVVVHAAYRQDGPEFRSINVEGSATVAEAAAESGATLIHVSTDVVFSGRRGRYREEDEPDPVTDYGASKAEAERAVRAACPDALVVRTSLVYGGPGYAPSRHEQAALDPDRTWFTDERRCPVQVGDLAAALLELAALDLRGGILHVAGADALSRCELARLLAGRDVRCASSREAGLDRPLDCTLDSSRAQALLRTRLRGAREVLA